MHKTFYASGFLYHPQSQQILLQQSTSISSDKTSFWTMMKGENNKNESAEDAFQRLTFQALSVKLHAKSIFPVYDYFHYEDKAFHYVFYGQVAQLKNIILPKSNPFSWFTFKQVAKLLLDKQAKQNIIVAQRVINANSRELARVLIDKR